MTITIRWVNLYAATPTATYPGIVSQMYTLSKEYANNPTPAVLAQMQALGWRLK